MLNALPGDEALESTVLAVGRRGTVVPGNIANLDNHDVMLDEAQAHFRSVDCLLNNAGVSVLSCRDLLDVSVDSFDHCHGSIPAAPSS